MAFGMFANFKTKAVAPDAPTSVSLSQDSNTNSWDVTFTNNSGGDHEVRYNVDGGAWLSWVDAGIGASSLLNQVVSESYNSNEYLYDLHGRDVTVEVRASTGGLFSAWVAATPITASFTAPSAPSTFTISENGFGIVSGTFTNMTSETHYIVRYRWVGIDTVVGDLGTLPIDSTAISNHTPAYVEPTCVDGDSWTVRVYSSRYGSNSAFKPSNTLTLANQPAPE